MNRDTVIGIVGAAILVTAMVGVFYYERNAAPVGPGAATGTAGNMTGPSVTSSVAVGQTDTKIVNLTQTTAANVTFHLTWTATNGRDTLKLTIAPPTGSGITQGAVSEPSDTGDITVTVPVPAGANPSGGWEVKVEFTSASPGNVGPATPPVQPPSPVPVGQSDANVDYQVAVSLK